MSEKLNLREKLHIGEKRTGGEKPRMSKKLKKGIIIAACAVGVCGAVWGGLTIARNAQRSDVKVYSVNDFCMTDYWGDTSSTSGMVTTDKIQKVFLSSSQTVNKVWVAEGDSVRKGDKLISYDSTLTQASVEQAKIDYDRQDESLTTAKNELEYLKKAKNKETLKQELDKLTAELDALKEKYAEVLDQLPVMDELYRKRLVLRKQRGGMEIESDEAKLIIDENGRCVDIVKRGRGTSECMIEEFMLLANQCAANAGRTNKVPFVYRVHEAPDAEKMEKLSATLLACGLNAKFKNPIPTQLELAALLDETRGQPIQTPVHTGILRSMQKARYAPQPLGHYGLVLADYAHFTSPIRRYPDLAIHRILSEMLLGASNTQMNKDFTDFAARASEQSSKQEVAAVRIERDVEDLYKAEYMHNHLGDVCMGTVAGITPRGVFVELENTVEGFVPAAELCKGEPQVVDGVSMVDPLTGRTWMLGTSMKVRVAAADVALGRIDFEYMVE